MITKKNTILMIILIMLCVVAKPIIVRADSANDQNTQTNTSGSNTNITGGYESTTTTTYEDGATNSTTTTSTTTSNSTGSDIPVNSANSPSFSSMSQDVCSMGVSGSVSTLGLGASIGKHVRDLNCERIKLSKVLYDYGMIGRLNNETRLRLVRLYLALVEKDPPRTVNAMDELGMLAPDFNRAVIEKGIEMSIKSMYGKKPDEMEVEQLMNMANKTMSKFPFKLPKHLALYLRMSTIIEGIYHTHKVDFKFIKVLRQILEEENLIKDAYVEEIKFSLKKFAQSVSDAVTIAPELKKYMDENRILQQQMKQKSNAILSGSITSSAVFIGSAFLFQTNETLGIAGMIASVVIFGIFAAFRKR